MDDALDLLAPLLVEEYSVSSGTVCVMIVGEVRQESAARSEGLGSITD